MRKHEPAKCCQNERKHEPAKCCKNERPTPRFTLASPARPLKMALAPERQGDAEAADGMQGIGALIEVRRHPGARRMTLRVSRTRRAVIVTLPQQCDLGEVDQFLRRNIAWVRERLDRLPEPVPFCDGALMPLRGEAHRLEFSGPLRGAAPVERIAAAGALPVLKITGRLEHAPRRLRDWLFAAAKSDLGARVGIHAAALNLKPRHIAVRDQTSRWGSCSTTRVLSFSWRLILAPPPVLDYVAAHEVAHLAEMNHGRRFWALVATRVPRLNETRDWLRVYGLDLHRYGASPDA